VVQLVIDTVKGFLVMQNFLKPREHLRVQDLGLDFLALEGIPYEKNEKRFNAKYEENVLTMLVGMKKTY
jgi:hypothetical protein